MSTLRVLVTAGGTREAIDDVRVITNLSTGRFGLAIAESFADLGCEVTILGSSKISDLQKRRELDPRLHFVPFDSYQDLQSRLEELSEEPYDLLLMAAAVSDYSPVRQTGKMSSNPETATISMTKNPKILSSLAESFGPRCSVVGFKLLSGVSHDELINVARKQLIGANLFMTVANDLAEINENAHPVFLVEADKETRLTGHRHEVAPQIAHRLFEHKREVKQSLSEVLKLDEQSQGQLYRREDKQGPYAALFHALPKIRTVLRTQIVKAIDALSTPDLKAPTVLELLSEQCRRGRYGGGPFSIQSPEQENLLAFLATPFPMRDRELVTPPDWSETVAETLLFENRIVARLIRSAGTAASHEKVLAIADAELKNELVIDRLIEFCAEESQALVMGAEDPLITLFERQGYKASAHSSSGFSKLTPPLKRDNLQSAGSICLFNPLNRSILLGRRLTPPWKDHWCFPGGKAEGNESPLEAARREFHEETGLTAPPWDPVSSRTVFVGSEFGRAYQVTNFQFVAIDQSSPSPSDELESSWQPIDQAMNLEPMGAGTKRILRHVLKLFQ